MLWTFFVLSIDRENRPSSKFEKATMYNPIPQHCSEVSLHPEIPRGNGNPKPPNFGPYCSHMIYVLIFGGWKFPKKLLITKRHTPSRSDTLPSVPDAWRMHKAGVSPRLPAACVREPSGGVSKNRREVPLVR